MDDKVKFRSRWGCDISEDNSLLLPNDHIDKPDFLVVVRNERIIKKCRAIRRWNEYRTSDHQHKKMANIHPGDIHEIRSTYQSITAIKAWEMLENLTVHYVAKHIALRLRGEGDTEVLSYRLHPHTCVLESSFSNDSSDHRALTIIWRVVL